MKSEEVQDLVKKILEIRDSILKLQSIPNYNEYMSLCGSSGCG